MCALFVTFHWWLGSEASGEGDQAGGRHPGSEGEHRFADSAPAGLRRQHHKSEQHRAPTGHLTFIFFFFFFPKVSRNTIFNHRLALCSQDLYRRCEKMRPTLFRLASDTEDNDEALGERWDSEYILDLHTKIFNQTTMWYDRCQD